MFVEKAKVFPGISLFFWFCFSCVFALSATISCSPKEVVECDAKKACPSGQVCQEGKCSAQTVEATQEPSRDASTPEEPATSSETTPENTPEPSTEKVPESQFPTIYRWTQATSPTQTDLYGVSMGSDTKAWAVGAKGTLLMSEDGGQTWKAQKSGTTEDLYAVSFADEKNGWIAGAKGLIFATKDGGKTWEKTASISVEKIRGLQFVNSQLGFAVGDNFTFLSTVDGGKTWQARSSTKGINLNGLSFKDKDTGFIVGSDGFIAFTLNGGIDITTAVTGTNITFRAIDYVGQVDGWAVGDKATIRSTNNRGSGWVPETLAKETIDILGVKFLSLNVGYMIGSQGTIMRTKDRGKTWLKLAQGKYPDLHNISMRSEKSGIIVGKKGTILFTKASPGVCNTGMTQKCYTGPEGTRGVGVCTDGTQECDNGEWGICKGQVLPASKEICFNNEDNNCNGKDNKEDGCPSCQDGQQKDCYTGPKDTLGTGICRSGKATCKDGAFGKCEKDIVPTKEDCNGKDDDCNGKVDDDIKFDVRPKCSNTFGVCGTGRKICVKGKWAACTAKEYGADYEKSESKCDGKDNDCDAAIDEGCTCPKDGDTRKCYNGPAGTQGVGECKDGAQTCKSGKWTGCEKQTKPVRELCDDKKDNDCDGKIDELNQYALSFSNRSRHYVYVKSAPELEPKGNFTLEGWYLFGYLGWSRGAAMVTKAESGGYGLYIDLPKKGQLGFRVRNKSDKSYVYVSGAYKGKLATQKWYHIAVTYDGSNLTLWLNGKKFATKAWKGPIAFNTKDVPLLIGAEASTPSKVTSGQYFSGRITQVHLSKKVLYTKEFTPSCNATADADTLAYWTLNAGAGTSELDSTKKHTAVIQTSKRKGPTWRESIRCKGYHPGGCKK